MRRKYLKLNMIAMVLLFGMTATFIEAGSLSNSLDPSKKCYQNIAELRSVDQAEDENAMLIKAKIAYREKRYQKVVEFADKAIEELQEDAKKMQDSLKEYPWQSKQAIFEYASLNAVGLAFYLKGKACFHWGQDQQAKVAFNEVVTKYYYAQCWCPAGLFLKPATLAQEELNK